MIEIVNDLVIDNIMTDAIIINVYSDNAINGHVNTKIDDCLDGYISCLLKDNNEISKYGNVNTIHTLDRMKAKKIIICGLGDEEELTLDKLRTAISIAIRTGTKSGIQSILYTLPDLRTQVHSLNLLGRTIAEGMILGTYQFQQYKTKKNDYKLDKLMVHYDDSKHIYEFSTGIEKGQYIAEGVWLARDLVNHPSRYMTPTQMAKEAAGVAGKSGLELQVLEINDMQQEKMNALLAVARGSDEPAKMIVLKYTGDVDANTIALIGKGITFDSGGISLKPSENMSEMKDDMAGGAAVLGAMLAIGRLKPRFNVIGIVPCVENMPSGKAYKPGDVLESMAGKTIEVISTDAEGRLILADALTYAQKLGADKLVDIATLTGACVVALGSVASGVITNDNEWCNNILAAAKYAGEKMWQLPNFPEYAEQIRSDIADLKNSGGRKAGAITAGMFLAEFVDKTPWAHIDIAGTANSNKEWGECAKGATGVGVRTLVSLVNDIL